MKSVDVDVWLFRSLSTLPSRYKLQIVSYTAWLGFQLCKYCCGCGCACVVPYSVSVAMLTSEIDVSCVKIAVQTEGQTMRKLIIAASLAFSLWATAAVANDLNDCILHVNNENYQLAL